MVKIQTFNQNAIYNVQADTNYVPKSYFTVLEKSTESTLFLQLSIPSSPDINITATVYGEFSYIGAKGSLEAVSGNIASSEIFLNGLPWENATHTPFALMGYVGAESDAQNEANHAYELSLLGGADVFVGSDSAYGADDAVIGLAGDDSFTGNTSSDYFDGGIGIDKAIFRGASGEYTITASATISDQTDSTGKTVLSGYLVADSIDSRDATDTFINVERLEFTDVTIALDTDASNSAGGIYRLYKAALDRTPDLGGLGYWIAQADAGTKDAVRMATDFTYADEFKTLYGVQTADNYMTGEDITALVTKIYENVLNRAPDEGGRDYYAGQITTHSKTVGQVLAEISDSAENKLAVVDLIATGIEYTPWVG